MKMDTVIQLFKQGNLFYSTAIQPLRNDASAFLPQKRASIARAWHALICRIWVFNVDREYTLLILTFTLPGVRFTGKIKSHGTNLAERAFPIL